MKQSVLILTIILTLTSCLEEGFYGCPDYIRLTFVYEGSTKKYDEMIGNDIHLRLYKDDLIYSHTVIPYEEIKGGREYVIKKEVTGDIDIIAWAVPANEKYVATIPALPESKLKDEEKIAMSPTLQNTTNEGIGHLYLGKVDYYDTDISQEIKAIVPMKSCIAQFSAAIHKSPDKNVWEESEEPIWLEIHGIKSEMDINFHPQGENALVRVPIIEIEDDSILRTGVHGLLSSEEDEFISIKAYIGDVHMFTLYTDIQSHPGDIIHMDIFTKYVTIQVNDWRIVDVPVEWI